MWNWEVCWTEGVMELRGCGTECCVELSDLWNWEVCWTEGVVKLRGWGIEGVGNWGICWIERFLVLNWGLCWTQGFFCWIEGFWRLKKSGPFVLTWFVELTGTFFFWFTHFSNLHYSPQRLIFLFQKPNIVQNKPPLQNKIPGCTHVAF